MQVCGNMLFYLLWLDCSSATHFWNNGITLATLKAGSRTFHSRASAAQVVFFRHLIEEGHHRIMNNNRGKIGCEVEKIGHRKASSNIGWIALPLVMHCCWLLVGETLGIRCFRYAGTTLCNG